MIRKSNTQLIKIIKILSTGDYHDGTHLGEQLQMTRSAIWKMIQKLVSYGIKIDSVKGKGYALLEPLILLDKQKIKKNLTNKKIHVQVFESMPSTNDYLRAQKKITHPSICLTEQQTQGKGRMQREWYSPFAKNIYLSCAYSFPKDLSELAGLSLVISLAIVATLKKMGVDDELVVKWPNDILYKNKKLSGALIEVEAESHSISKAVIGIGLNVNMLQDEIGAITQAWTSMQKILAHYIDRNLIAIELINTLEAFLQLFAQEGFAPFAKQWEKIDCLMQQTITLKVLNAKIKGTVTGVDERGQLLMKLADGKIHSFSSGDTSVEKKS